MQDCGIVCMTASSRDEAERIARALVEKRLAACVQLVSDIRSVYWWQGSICDENEVFFMAKTTRACFDELTAEVKRLHSYDVPEIVYIPIAVASPDYQGWIVAETK